MKTLAILTVTISALVACTTNALSATPINSFQVPSGTKVDILAVAPVRFTSGNGQALMLKYETTLKVADKPRLEKEADDVWDLFRSEAEKSGTSAVILSANEKTSDGTVRVGHSFNFVIEKDAAGNWRCSNDKVVTIGSPAKIIYRQALQLVAQKHYQEAIARYTKSIALDPTYSQSYADRGMCYLVLKQFDKSLSDIDKAISLCSANAQYYINRGAVHGDRKEYNKVVEDCEKAMSLKLQPAMQAGAFGNRGEAYFKLGQYDKAVDDLTKAILTHPQPAECYYYRSLAYEKLGKKELSQQDKAKADQLGYKPGSDTLIIDSAK
jgi:tetratricopeptide (TPR) repeat protein